MDIATNEPKCPLCGLQWYFITSTVQTSPHQHITTLLNHFQYFFQVCYQVRVKAFFQRVFCISAGGNQHIQHITKLFPVFLPGVLPSACEGLFPAHLLYKRRW